MVLFCKFYPQYDKILKVYSLPYTLLNLKKLKYLMFNTIDFPPTGSNSYTLKSSPISQLLHFCITFDCCILSCIEKWQSKGENTAKKIMLLRSSALPNNYLKSKVLVTKQCLLKIKLCWLFRTQVSLSWTVFPFHTKGKTKTCMITMMFMSMMWS